MLILQRRKGEALSINDNITLTITDIGNDWVKLAIDAPRDIPILRSELKDAIEENKKASETVPMNLLEQILKEN